MIPAWASIDSPWVHNVDPARFRTTVDPLAGAEVEFLVDDLTHLTTVTGEFDLIVDYGTFDDLSVKDRAAYVDQVLPLAKPGAKFLLWCFEWEPKTWERAASVIMPIGKCRGTSR